MDSLFCHIGLILNRIIRYIHYLSFFKTYCLLSSKCILATWQNLVPCAEHNGLYVWAITNNWCAHDKKCSCFMEQKYYIVNHTVQKILEDYIKFIFKIVFKIRLSVSSNFLLPQALLYNHDILKGRTLMNGQWAREQQLLVRQVLLTINFLKGAHDVF